MCVCVCVCVCVCEGNGESEVCTQLSPNSKVLFVVIFTISQQLNGKDHFKNKIK